MKKALSLILVTMIAITTVFASGASETKEKAPEDIVITFATERIGVVATEMEKICQEFSAETGYVVDFQAPGSSYEELMKTKMSANELPDVFTTHGWSVARYSDYLMPINDFEWAGKISPQIKKVITDKDGNMFVLPVDIDVAGVICNMDVLAEAGVDPDGILTWADFADACEKVKAIGKTPLHIGGKEIWTIGQYFDWAAPSFYITDERTSEAENLKNGIFNKDIWVELCEQLDAWKKAGYINVDCLTATYLSDTEALATGSAAFGFYGNSTITNVHDINPDANIGMIPVPSNSPDDARSLIAGEHIAIGIWKDTPVKEAAIELLNYFARPEVMKRLSEVSGNRAGFDGIPVEIGEIGEYLEKYSDIETYSYFDREYLPSGMWDVMCATGADILAQKPNAIKNAADIMARNFEDKYVD